MSGLKKKLGLYDFDRTKSSGQSEPAFSAAIESTEAQIPSENAAASDVDFGRLRLNQIAPAVYRYRRIDANPGLGARTLAEYLPFQLSGVLELALWPQPEALHPEDVLFLDTETTGLNRGAGTLPFLTGLASFESNQLVRELIYLAEPGGEEDYLEYLQQTFRRFKYLVSYNGRAFDVPLLRNRLILNRKPGMPEFLHFDLLHIFRRLFPKGSLPGYRQMDLEQRLLAHERVDDLPGAEIPQLYFDYVKYGHDGGMERVFEHNLQDLTGMVLLFLEAIRAYDRRDSARGSLRSGLARILVRNRREEQALALLRDLEQESDVSVVDPAYADDTYGGLRYRDFLLLGQLHRARGRYAEAVSTFERIIARYDCPYARMALAKLLEHRLKDFAEARRHTQALMARFQPEPNAGKGLYAAAELQKRLDRIEKKLARLNETKV